MGEKQHKFAGGQSEGGTFLDSPLKEQQEETLPFVVMSFAGETFAVEIGRVREIIRVPHMTWIPGSPAHVKGVINLRGSVVAVVDPAILLSLPQTEPGPDSRVVIIDSSDEPVGILVDSVSRVASICPSAIEPSMRTLDRSQRLFIAAQTNIEDSMVGLLDIDKVIEKVRSLQEAA